MTRKVLYPLLFIIAVILLILGAVPERKPYRFSPNNDRFLPGIERLPAFPEAYAQGCLGCTEQITVPLINGEDRVYNAYTHKFCYWRDALKAGLC